MAGSSIITALTVLFSLVTLAGVVAAAYRFRRLPVAAMIAAADRRVKFHRDAAAALESAIAGARTEGKEAQAAQLEASLAGHRRALRGLAAAEPFAGER